MLSIYLKQTPSPFPMGQRDALILNSYIHSGKISQSEKTEAKPVPSPPKIVKTMDEKAITKIISSEKLTASPMEKSTPSISLGESAHLIPALLHDAIQKKQHYPQAALHMERQGRVTVAFTLMQDGSVDHLKIVSSSGTGMLDQAALNAVLAASPFHEVKKYIQHIEEYQIDIVFELT